MGDEKERQIEEQEREERRRKREDDERGYPLPIKDPEHDD